MLLPTQVFVATFGMVTLIHAETDPTSPDYSFAQSQWADVNCYYNFDAGGNFLNYVVRIEPTGQDNTNAAWCTGIINNIRGERGRVIGYESCNDYLTYNLHQPQMHEITAAKGIDMYFHWEWPWSEGEDEVACITTAIRKATCDGEIAFQKEKCYSRH